MTSFIYFFTQTNTYLGLGWEIIIIIAVLHKVKDIMNKCTALLKSLQCVCICLENNNVALSFHVVKVQNTTHSHDESVSDLLNSVFHEF